MKCVYITEEQLARFLLSYESSLIVENTNGKIDMEKLKNKIKTLLKKGISISVIVAAIVHSYNMGYDAAWGAAQEAAKAAKEGISNIIEPKINKWELVADDVLATVYNVVPEQCNDDIMHTASMFRLNLNDVLSHRIIAMERTMMAKFGLKYGDVVKIEGTGKWDGEWQIQDTMNKRFAGQNKIDILVPNSVRTGKWDNVKVYKLNDPDEVKIIKQQMAPQLTKQEAAAQLNRLKDNFT